MLQAREGACTFWVGVLGRVSGSSRPQLSWEEKVQEERTLRCPLIKSCCLLSRTRVKKRTDLTGAFRLDPVYLRHSHQDSGELGPASSSLFPSRPRPQHPGARVKHHSHSPGGPGQSRADCTRV